MAPKFDYFKLPANFTEDYGLDWPAKTPQIIKELSCYTRSRFDDVREGKMCSPFHHFMVACRLNWRDRIKVAVEKNGKRYDNFFFEEVIRELCSSMETMLTGPGSAGKTCPVAVYNLLSFYARPDRTTALVSTTSVKGADMRLWGEIRDLHQSATFKVGYVLESFKSITFDRSHELNKNRGSQERDMRNSLTVVAIPEGAEGRGAVRSIIGTKNDVVLWSIDELPEMTEGILGDAAANLETNRRFHLIGIGNAKAGNNPHRQACEPKAGWDGFDPNNAYFGGSWDTKSGGRCLFLSGLKSPNCAPELMEAEKDDLPFPFLSNPVANRRNAIRFGQGDPEAGERTLSYFRMNIGIWPDGDVEATALTANKVRRCGADKDVPFWGPEPRITYCGCDPAFSTGGDSFELVFGTRGRDIEGVERLRVDAETVRVEIDAGSKDEYAKAAAKKVVPLLISRGVEPRRFSIDVSSDGGIIAQAIMQEWKSNDILLISSMGKPSDLPVSIVDTRKSIDVYDRRVSELWLHISVGVEVGVIRNYNVHSRYARDHFTRGYEAVGGGKLSIEKKPDYKAIHGRSPDAGDAFAYLWEVVRQDGIEMGLPDSDQKDRPFMVDEFLSPQKSSDNWQLSGDSYGSVW